MPERGLRRDRIHMQGDHQDHQGVEEDGYKDKYQGEMPRDRYRDRLDKRRMSY